VVKFSSIAQSSAKANDFRETSPGSRVFTHAGQVVAWQRPLSQADINRLGASSPVGDLLAVKVANLEAKRALVALLPKVAFDLPDFHPYAVVVIALEQVTHEALRVILAPYRGQESDPESKPENGSMPGQASAAGQYSTSVGAHQRNAGNQKPATLQKRKPLQIVAGAIGELLLTLGVLTFLFLGWQASINNVELAQQQTTQAINTHFTKPTPHNLQLAQVFAKLYIPAFGKDWVRTIGQGTRSQLVLDKVGVGHYISSQMPAQIGNFAIAAHRTTKGASFLHLDKLVKGDLIYVETYDGWYTYAYTNQVVVHPTETGVIRRMPKFASIQKHIKYITLTTCTPIHTATDRLIAFGVQIGFTPRQAGAPEAIAALATRGIK
jgi:sortase A